MNNDVSIWLLILIAIPALRPAHYVLRHVASWWSRHDITQPAADLSWRSSDALMRNGAILVGLGAVVIGLFTDTAAILLQSEKFVLAVMVGIGSYVLVSVGISLMTGKTRLVRLTSLGFERAAQPKRYWTSTAWHLLLGGLLFVGGLMALVETPVETLRAQCYDWENEYTARQRVAACDLLLADHPDEDRSDVLFVRGSAYFHMGDYRRAGADYTASIRFDPQDSISHYNLGLVHEQLADQRQAIENYSAAIDLDPQEIDAWERRGFIHLRAGRFDQAITDLDSAYKLQPNNVSRLAQRGIAYAWNNDPRRAGLYDRQEEPPVPSDPAAWRGPSGHETWQSG